MLYDVPTNLHRKKHLKTQQKTTKRFCHAINFLELDLKSLYD